MTATASIKIFGTAFSEPSGQKSPCGEPDCVFFLRSLSESSGDTETAPAEETKGGSDTDGKKEPETQASYLLGLLASFYMKTAQNLQGGLTSEKTGASSEEITDILEGNDLVCDTDIASMVAAVRNEAPGGEKTGTDVARMPQMTGCSQDAKGTTAHPQQQSSVSCPLENFSNTGSFIGDSAGEPPGAAVSAAQIAQNSPGAEAGRGLSSIPDPSEPSKAPERGADSGALSGSQVSGALTGETAAGAMEAKDLLSGEKERQGAPETNRSSPLRHAEDPVSSVEGYTVTTHTSQASDVPILEAAVSDALDRFSDMISAFGKEKDGSFEIQLEPEYLGKLSISLSPDGDGIRAQIRTKDANIQSLLSGEVAKLVDKLDSSGIRLKSVDIVCADMTGQQMGSQSAGNFSGRENPDRACQSRIGTPSAYEFPDFEIPEAWAETEIAGCTVIFRA